MKTAFVCALFLAGQAAASQDPTFRAGTELVEVSVIAQDKQGKPVADLRREEFELFDNGQPQAIRLFAGETTKSDAAPAPSNTANTFTNQIAASAGSSNAYAVILIDNLYSGSDPAEGEGSALARSRALQMLRAIPAGEKIAIYAPGLKLRVICEFTSDRDLLERQLRKWKPTPTTPAEQAASVFRVQANPQLPELRGNAAAEVERIDALQRSEVGDAQMELVADHLAAIPGRKNLIWLANRFPLGPQALRKLSLANVAIYPIDLDGVCYSCSERPTQWMDQLAALTGGVAYYKRNDLNIAIREAMDDGRISYTLGFYPAALEDGPAPAHHLTVKVSRPGVVLRYRTSYQVDAAQPVSATPADLLHALNGPVDSAAIPFRVKAARTQDRLTLDALFDAKDLDLVQNQNLRTGRVEIVARFVTADGVIAGNPFHQTLALNLLPNTWDAAVREGLPWRGELRIPPKATELKLLVANTASGRIGTLTIPLSKVLR
jgi:VWFA-related protein